MTSGLHVLDGEVLLELEWLVRLLALEDELHRQDSLDTVAAEVPNHGASRVAANGDRRSRGCHRLLTIGTFH